MNSISADDGHKDFRVTVSRGLTKTGEDQYQILVAQKASRAIGTVSLAMLSFSPEEWETIGKIVRDLRSEISTHILTAEE